MTTQLNFNLSHRKKKQTRGGSWTHRSSTMKLFVTIYYHEVISHLQSNSNLYDEVIVKLPLYAIIFSSHEKIGSMGEEKNPENSSISHIGTLFLFSVRDKIIYCFLCWETVLLWYVHLYPGVFTNYYWNQ